MTKYKIEPFGNKTLSWWYSKKNSIDFDPSYQRKGGLWSIYDKGYLIDSIINGFDVPKIYLADFSWNESPLLNTKKKLFAIIDGKQRLEAIFEFFDNKIALNDDFTYLRDQKVNAAGMKYADLDKTYPSLSEEFREFNLSVVAVVTDNEEIINELFVRLNRNKSLTGAEIRNAMKGSIPRVIRQVANHSFFRDYVSFDMKRGQDLNAAAKLLMFEYYESVQTTKKTNLDEFAKINNLDNKKMEDSLRRTIENLNTIESIFLPKDKLLKLPGLVPVYYWFIRNQDEANLVKIRAFLVWFENKRKEAKNDDSRIIDFIQYNRSTNDEISFVKRIEILENLFSKYLKGAL
jgi:hypothetical protein